MVVAAQLRTLAGKLTTGEDQALIEKLLGQLRSGIARERTLQARLSTDWGGPRDGGHEPSNGSRILNDGPQKLIR
jgi:hypothetical protein